MPRIVNVDRLACLLVSCFVALGTAQAASPTAPPTLHVDCPALTHEHAAEVEARARAELLIRNVAVERAEFRCTSDRTIVSLTAQHQSVVEHTALSGTDLKELLLAGFSAALQRLAPEELTPPNATPTPEPPVPSDESPGGGLPAGIAPPAALESVPPPSPAPRPNPTPSQPPPEGPPGDRAKPAPPSVRWTAEVAGGAALEWWRHRAALGAALEASYGRGDLSLGMTVGVLTAVPSSEAFQALEFSTALGAHWQPATAAGVRLQASVGASLLSVTPEGPYRPRGASSVSAGFALLAGSRPVWFGSWALIPTAGVRLFAAERRVTLDDDAQLVIGYVTPHLTVSLARALE